MTDSTFTAASADHRFSIGFADFIAGMVKGYRAYRIYSDLDAKSDSALAAMNISRSELPRLAARAII
jgi:hypothetical protein